MFKEQIKIIPKRIDLLLKTWNKNCNRKVMFVLLKKLSLADEGLPYI